MDALDLLRNWPSWRQAGAGKVLASPAWRQEVLFADWKGALRIIPESDLPADRLWLKVSFEGEAHHLGIVDSAVFPDLHRVWTLRDKLPREVLMALVEKECGSLLQLLEDTLRRQLSVEGLAEAVPETSFRAFRVTAEDDHFEPLTFSLDLSPAMEIDLGRLENIDVTDESILTLSRPAEAVYAEFDLQGMKLADGDLLLRPVEQAPRWLTEIPRDGRVRVLSSVPHTLTFAEFVDGLPPVPPSPTYRIVRDEMQLATAVSAAVGSHPAYKITSTL